MHFCSTFKGALRRNSRSGIYEISILWIQFLHLFGVVLVLKIRTKALFVLMETDLLNQLWHSEHSAHVTWKPGNVAVLTELSGRMRRPTFSSASFTENKMKQPFLTVFAEIKYWYSSGTGETSACSEERTIYIALLVGIKPAGTRHSNFLLLRKISNARSKFAALRTVPGVIFQARGCAWMVFLLHCFVCLWIKIQATVLRLC